MNVAEGRGASGISVFVAEDDADFRATLAAVLRRDGHTVFEASNGETMLFHLAQLGAHRGTRRLGDEIVVCDIRMPGCDGLSVLRNLREHDADCPPFIFIAAFPDADLVREAHELGALTVFAKPFDLSDLRELVRRHARQARAI
jgi:two-component system response regulator (stage 0 sporulation protein F)